MPSQAGPIAVFKYIDGTLLAHLSRMHASVPIDETNVIITHSTQVYGKPRQPVLCFAGFVVGRRKTHMFGFGKTGRAEKALKSALGIFFPGDNASRDEIIKRSKEDTSATVNTIKSGADPYQAAAMLVALYIRDKLSSVSDDTRQRMLRVMGGGISDAQPRIFKFSTHMVTALIKLETGSKPLVPEGTTVAFLDSVAQAFSEDEGVKAKISAYFYKTATQPRSSDDD